MSRDQTFSFSGSKSHAGKEAAGRAKQSSGANKLLEIENRLNVLGQNTTHFEALLAKAMVSLRNTKATMKEYGKNSDEYDALSRELERLENEIGGLKDRLKLLKGKRASAGKEMDVALAAYKTAIDVEFGNGGYSGMINGIRSAVTDAKDLHVQFSAELAAAEKRYEKFGFEIPAVREKLDAALKVVAAVEKAMGRA